MRGATATQRQLGGEAAAGLGPLGRVGLRDTANFHAMLRKRLRAFGATIPDTLASTGMEG